MKKRPDGRYQLSVMVGYNDNGKPKRKIVYGRTQKEVNEKANELRAQVNMGLKIDSDITVREWADIWLRTYKSGVEYNTKKMYDITIRNMISPYLGDVKLKDLKTAHLQKVVNSNTDKHRTLEIFRITMNQMLEQAIINDLIIKNTAKGLKLPTKNKTTSKRALTNEEIQKIKGIELDARTKCFVFLLMYTGIRRGEALALTKNDIDFDSGVITINKNLVMKGNVSEIKYSPKTASGFRTIPILEPLKEILEQHINSIETDLLFTTQKGETITQTSYRRMWQKFEKAIGTKEITAHIFRHNFATILYNAGVDMKSAQQILGHSNINVTLDIYTHLDAQNKQNAADKLNLHLTKFD